MGAHERARAAFGIERRTDATAWCCHVWTAPILQGLMSCWIDRMGAVRLIATCLRLARLGPKASTSGGKRLPVGQCSRASLLVSLTIDEVTFRVKMVVQAGVN